LVAPIDPDTSVRRGSYTFTPCPAII